MVPIFLLVLTHVFLIMYLQWSRTIAMKCCSHLNSANGTDSLLGSQLWITNNKYIAYSKPEAMKSCSHLISANRTDSLLCSGLWLFEHVNSLIKSSSYEILFTPVLSQWDWFHVKPRSMNVLTCTLHNNWSQLPWRFVHT